MSLRVLCAVGHLHLNLNLPSVQFVIARCIVNVHQKQTNTMRYSSKASSRGMPVLAY